MVGLGDVEGLSWPLKLQVKGAWKKGQPLAGLWRILWVKHAGVRTEKGGFSGAPSEQTWGNAAMQWDWLSGISGLGSRGRALAPQAPKLSSVHSDPQVRWMMYWIVFAIFMAAETFTDVFISWSGTRIGRRWVRKAYPPAGTWLTHTPPLPTGSLFTMRSRWPSCCGCSRLTPRGPACFTESLFTRPYPAMRRYPRGSRGKTQKVVSGRGCVRESPVSQVQGGGDVWV